MQRQSVDDLISSIITAAIEIQENKNSLTHRKSYHEDPEFQDVQHNFKCKSYLQGRNYMDRIDRKTTGRHRRRLTYLVEKKFRQEISECLKCGQWDEVEKILSKYKRCDRVRKGTLRSIDLSICPHQHSPLKSLNALSLICRNGYSNCIVPVLDLESSRLSLAGFQHALVEAVREGHLHCYHRLMESRLMKSSRLDESPYHEILAFSKSAEFDHVKRLLRSLDIKDEFPMQDRLDLVNLLIMYGCPASCLSLSILLKLGIEANRFDSNGMNPISIAVLSNNIGCVHYLLGPQVGWSKSHHHGDSNTFERTPLMFAASVKDPSCLELFLQYCDRDSVNYKTSSGWTALTFACLYGNTESVSMLVEAGADMNIRDARSNSIIIAAMKSGNTKCLRLVLRKLNQIDDSQTLIEMTRDIKCLVENVDCLRIFIEHFNFDLDTVFNNGDTLLTVASSKGYLDSVRWLLEWGASIDLKSGEGCTALMRACIKDHNAVVKLLIEKGANIDEKTYLGNTAMTNCIHAGNLTCLNLLLAAGADPNTIANNKVTLFTKAMLTNEVKAVDMLLEHGKILQNGELKQMHKDSMARWTSRQNSMTPLSLTHVMKRGLFDWGWLTGNTFRKTVFSAVYSGICPRPVKYYTLKMTPLVLSLVLNEVTVAKYCLANLYFFPEDYSMLCSNQLVRYLMEQRRQETARGAFSRGSRRRGNLQDHSTHISSLLEKVTHQPFSLQTWSFLTVSKAISLAGASTKRWQRVNALPIPDFLKQTLKFQTDLSRVCLKFVLDEDIGTPGEMVFTRTRRRRSAVSSVKSPHYCINCGGLGSSFEHLGIELRKLDHKAKRIDQGGSDSDEPFDQAESEDSDETDEESESDDTEETDDEDPDSSNDQYDD